MNKNLKILLIGGNGFIGKVLKKALLERGYGNVKSVSRKDLGVDITKVETLERYILEADVVVNLAGMISFAWKNRGKLLEINGEGALNVLRVCEKNKKLHRLIHLSSTSAFGAPESEVDESFRFDWAGNEGLVYSYSKFVANDEIVESEVPTNIVYPCASLGAGNKNTQRFLKYAKDKSRIFLPPGTNAVMDVRDLVEAIVVVMEKAPKNENYILCGESLPFSELFETVFKILKQDTKITVLPKWLEKPMCSMVRFLETMGSKKIESEQMYLSFQSLKYSNEKIKRLGYKAKYSLKETLENILADSGLYK